MLNRLDPLLVAELAALGHDVSDPRLPVNALDGVFEFVGVITDNAVTPSDLTAANMCFDASFVQAFGSGADPAAILKVDALTIALEVEGVGDALGIVADVMQNLVVRHQKGTRDVRMSMGRYAGTYHTAYSVADTTTAGAAQIRERFTRAALTLRLKEPLYVNMRSDTFEVYPMNAVNVAANIAFHLWVEGAAWREAFGEPNPGNLGELGEKPGRSRAADRIARRQLAPLRSQGN